MASEIPESSSSSSSSSSAPKGFDVFLSFRGEDIRKNFLGHLYNALVNAGINTFKDNINLERGEEIGPGLSMAIKESRISIPVFSADYASSTWCLEELAHIMDCKEKFDQTVFPIFFSADPSDIRKQKGSFEKAFSNHEKKLEKETVERWRESLRKAANLSGLTLQQVGGDEAELIKLVVSEILSKLNSIAHLDVTNHLVGIDSHVESVMNLLNVDATKASFVGICGMGGLGKTTIAKDVFNRMFRCFDGSSFIDDVRESSKQGLVNLQNILLSNIIKEHPNISIVSRGITVIKDRLHAKKVLIVLDDVDDKNQLESLAGEPDWFGPGSKIVITTRDESVLKGKGIRIYRPKEMDLTQSLVLFSKHAFRSDQPEEDFTDISKEIVRISGGLPLALQVLGSSLSDTRVRRDWESRLDSLKKSPDLDVKKKLEISYEVLGRKEKEMFLDVACFFIGMEKETAIVIWEGCGFPATYGINVLIYKSLVKIGEYNELRMHDQLRDMGREIIRERSHQGPGTYSRLWDHEEALDVLEQDIGTTNVQGFALDFIDGYRKGASSPTTWQEGCLNSESFARMSQLRLLKVNNAHLVGVFERFPRQLRWLSWRQCPLDFIPTNIQLGKLVVLDLSWSSIRQVWSDEHQNQMATKLKILDLSHCSYLTRTPDFSQHPDLERLDLRDCSELVEVDKSIGNLKKTLKFLNLGSCSNLRELPSSLFTLEHVENLDLSRCSGLTKLPGEMGPMESLRKLDLSQTAIEQLPDSIGNLKNLTMLSLDRCFSLKKLPNSLGKLESLRELVLSSTGVKEVPVSIGSLKNLEILRASSCASLSVLPDSIGDLESLSRLELDGTPVHELPSSIGSLSKLKCFSLSRCLHLTKFPEAFGMLHSLETLEMDGCQEFRGFPENFGSLARLKALNVRHNSKLTGLPEDFGMLHSLETLQMDGCQEFRGFPENFGSLARLKVLNVRHNSKLTGLPNSFSSLRSLEEVNASYCNLLDGGIPSDLGRFSSLVTLWLGHNSFCSLPDSINDLSKLEYLCLTNCRKLKYLPELPSGLYELDVGNCISLERLPNLSNLKYLEELTLANCEKLKEIEGIESLESLEILSMIGCNMNKKTLRNIFVQGVFKRLFNFSFPGSEIPSWFTHQEPTCVVHRRVDCKMDWVFLCIVFALEEEEVDQMDESPAIEDISVVISGENRFSNREAEIRGIPKAHQDQVFMRFYKAGSFHIEEGSQIKVSIESAPRIKVKKVGVHVVYKPLIMQGLEDSQHSEEDINEKLAEFFTPCVSTVGASHSVPAESTIVYDTRESVSERVNNRAREREIEIEIKRRGYKRRELRYDKRMRRRWRVHLTVLHFAILFSSSRVK